MKDIIPMRQLPGDCQPTQRFPTHLLEAARYAATTQGEGSSQAESVALSTDDRKALYDFVIEV